MPFFDESCVLVPVSTLEDFPKGGSDANARNLLAAWSVLWHPAVVVACNGAPLWYRADSIPGSEGRRLIAVPDDSREMMPEDQRLGLIDLAGLSCPPIDWQSDVAASNESAPAVGQAYGVTGADRNAMLTLLGLNRKTDSTTPSPIQWPDFPESVRAGHRTVVPDDFFALAYANLQIQVMTRRLRYSSNLDEMQLRRHATAAAEAFVARDGETCVAAMHDAFDSIAEERDHYFASDPSLIDLVLLTPATLCQDAMESWGEDSHESNAVNAAPTSPPSGADIPAEHEVMPDNRLQSEIESETGTSPETIHAAPRNVLLDRDVCEAIHDDSSGRFAALVSAIRDGKIGWAGGSPGDVEFDLMSFDDGRRALIDGHSLAVQTIGEPPKVYGRFCGGTPSDFTPTLGRLGYVGVIPIDFRRGTGHGEEAKVVLQSGGTELEALTAKPIDATSDASFLDLAAKLGESIDSGEIATALLVHWPGKTCDSFQDLRRAASWSLALGKFWRLQDYFVDGEHPYHHGTPTHVSNSASQSLSQAVNEDAAADPISTVATDTRDAVIRQATLRLHAMADLASGKARLESSDMAASPRGGPQEQPAASAVDGLAESAERLAAAMGYNVDTSSSSSDSPADAAIVLNPSSSGGRREVRFSQPVSRKIKHVYGVSRESGSEHDTDWDLTPITGSFWSATTDAPGHGFSVLRGNPKVASEGGPFSRHGWLGRKWFGDGRIARGDFLGNQFLEAQISMSSGGISSVFSGPIRGNRFSMRLIRVAEGNPGTKCQMIADKVVTVRNGNDLGTIQATGRLVDDDQTMLAEFDFRYSLLRGSRNLRVTGSLRPAIACNGDPWKNYFALRIATATESAIDRVIVRDKLHRAPSRRMVAPLGVVLDEAERQTLIASHGLAYHRRVGERFVDTLLCCQGETSTEFQIDYGFDIPAPVSMAKSVIAPPVALPISPSDQAVASEPQGWLIHRRPSTIELSDVTIFRRDDGHLAGIIRVMQTSGQSVKAKLRFCRTVAVACRFDGDQATIDAPLDALRQKLDVDGDAIKFSIAGHAVLDLLVVFQRSDQTQADAPEQA
ncbi:hypothetical protein [Crateriforma spongiae]|uniref:hypothetical protein n=1 Tax=Crateriforma spongiae TaxID=2724528 RepID=UPI0039B0CA0B